MKKRTSLNMEISSNVDLSLLRKPLTPFTGFQEAKNAFEKGTAEVRHLLLHECSLIYECNVCRNMFRSLANFISHKRVFCCKSALERDDSHDSTNSTESPKSSTAREFLPPKNLTHHKCMQVQTSDDAAATTTTRCVKIDHNSEENSAECEEASPISPKSSPTNELNEAPNKCTVKSNNDHASLSYVFQCPSCSLTFLKSASVIRHLALGHNIPMRRIRMLRNTILKRPAKTVFVNGVDELPRAKPNRELKNLLMTNTETDNVTATTVTIEDEQTSNTVPIDQDLTKCIFCQMSFDRRATLSAHLQTCQVKLEMLLDSPTERTSTQSNKRMRFQTNTSSTPNNNQIATTAAIAADVDCGMFNEVDDVKRTFEHLERQDFGAGLQTVSLDKLDISTGESTNASVVLEKEITSDQHSTTAADLTKSDDFNGFKMNTDSLLNDVNMDSVASSSPSSPHKKRKVRTNCVMKQSCRCKICGKQFNALSNLRRHISMFHYRSRKFGCALCEYCAFRRYDIINHLGFVHKMSGEDNAEAAKLVRVNDVPYTKDDMEEDIVLLNATSENNNADDENSENLSSTKGEPDMQPEKRHRRRKKNLVCQLDKSLESKQTENDFESSGEIKLTRQTLKRSLSQNSANNAAVFLHKSTKGNQKRPTRNRVKHVNKDFVYDLMDVIKKEQAQSVASAIIETETYHLRGSKRRNTLNAVQRGIKRQAVPGFEFIKPKMYSTIKGAARRSLLLLVNQSLAASSTLPEIPSARPEMRSRLISMQRSDSQAGTIIESTELDAACLKSLPLCDDSYLEKIAKESVGSFQMKPCLAQQQQHSALDTLLQKVDCSKNFLNGGNVRSAGSNQVRSDMSEIVVQTNYLEADAANENVTAATTPISPCYITPEQSISKAFVTPSKPQKRLPSLDSIAETINSSSKNYFNASPLEH